ncbi:hypothetical protein [Dongshaea marina]|uniref:hypothetical protein n=1 Tax=Dongshaea marina TaxID=2047966 RepID=UPI000D3E28A5|nr:hypothetical protein [Dongshaea marina]
MMELGWDTHNIWNRAQDLLLEVRAEKQRAWLTTLNQTYCYLVEITAADEHSFKGEVKKIIPGLNYPTRGAANPGLPKHTGMEAQFSAKHILDVSDFF